MSRNIYLLRHGKTEANLQRLYCGSTDLPLCETGLEELKMRKEQGIYPPPEGLCFITSGMRRANETLKAIYGETAFTVCPALREMDFGRFEMKSYGQLKNDPDYQAWITGNNEENVPPGGESGMQMRARVLAGWSRLLREQEGDLLLVLHGGSIAAIVEALEPENKENRYQRQPDNGCGWHLIMAGQRLLHREPIGGR